MIKVIPTTYKGVTYRSRTEARWAVFFEAMGWPFTYEADGVDLDGEWYLPDFWLPALETFVEIKGADPTEDELRLAAKLHEASGKQVLLFAGAPGTKTHAVWQWRRGVARHSDNVAGFIPGRLLACRRCPRAAIGYSASDGSEWGWEQLDNPADACRQRDCGDRFPTSSGKVAAAFEAASNERFGVHE